VNIRIKFYIIFRRLVTTAAQGKKVIITETGGPDQGKINGEAQNSQNDAMRYFINTQKWSMQENIEMFYFSSFD